MSYRRILPVSLLISLAACGSEPNPHRQERASIEALPVDHTWTLPELEKPAHVVATEAGVPHVYAASERDAWMVTGFLHARDRYTQIELTRRFGQGILTELVGEAALATDQETRGRGGNEITDRLLAQLTTEEAALLDAYVEGMNVYVREHKNNPFHEVLPPPTELPLVAIAIAANEYPDVMREFTRRDAVALLTAVLFNSSFTSDDLARQEVLDSIPDLIPTGAPNAALREAGARDDLFDWVKPNHPIPSANGFGLETTASFERRLKDRDGVRRPRLPEDVLARAARSGERYDALRRGPRGSESGSNAWALSGRGTPDGHALLAGDGHLPLSVPTLLYQMGMDTTVYGGRSGQSLLGLYFPGIPAMPIGTNGHVAFSFTYLYGDLTDWYAEQIELGPDGTPSGTLFQGTVRPTTFVDEQYVIADVPSLGSVGRTESWRRWKTFDGRLIVSIEGVPADTNTPGPGESVVSLAGERLIPRDTNGDSIISGVSFDYTGLDVSNLYKALREVDRARSVEDFRDTQRQFVGLAQNFVAADTSGSVYYSGYTGTPCRTNLQRVGTGDATRFADGADPRLVLDGTQYGAFEIPVGADNEVDEAAAAANPARCVVPFDRWPQAIDPPSGYAVTANNDHGGTSFDNSLANDEFYTGGPFEPGHRTKTIADTLAGHVAAQDGSVEAMAALQAEHTSVLALEFHPFLATAIAEVRALTAPGSAEEGRVRALYLGDEAAIEDAMSRMAAWIARGATAESGVTTFYESPTQAQRDDAVATMIWNAFFRYLNQNVYDDENLDTILALDSRFMRATSLRRMLRGRGAGNAEGLASFDAATGESVFFDDASTPGVTESSREILVASLVDALASLRAPSDGQGGGGFGTTDANQWLWGLRHRVEFPSLITAYAGNISGIELIAAATRISTVKLPLAEGLATDDPRRALDWFPRPGDWFSVDASNPGVDGPDYDYRNGPVMRMVVELGPQGFVRGQNILPAGQSGVAVSPYFLDQARLWLGNDTVPMRYTVEDVVAHATGHEVFSR